ncbi:PEP-CTERM sorting domain-containing protein [Cylindrospermum sp. FACHB-282]|uniref:PEP-CTERM sorting domain-containing protein n=1 Tax=Cylindrospermum sp. FACHB-282 TaxID=2692794 RepID=UPI0016879CF2|nr:PEP-CTERM sorting domain-containing protein [Cylindrospermum sp. FACHB-282]MBD2386356.1 PEP-CTERM sorting domain-containing protein [Cylindrospermum sp. FACHB-282]
MTYSIFKKLAVVTAGTALMFAVGENIPAQAVTITYDFSGSNAGNPFTGTFSFDSAAASDQEVTVAEGLIISANYDGNSYTQADDSLAKVLTNLLGGIDQQGLGLQFYTNAFTVNAENFIVLSDATGNSDQTVSYTDVSVPEPTSIFGLAPVFGLFLFMFKKMGFSTRSLRTKSSP